MIIKEHIEKGTSLSELARVNNVHPITLYQWKRKMNTPLNPNKNESLELLKKLEKLKSDHKLLTKALGELTLSNQCLKEAVEFLKKKSESLQLKSQKSSS